MPRRVYDSRQKALLDITARKQELRVNARQRIRIRQAEEMEKELFALDNETSTAIQAAVAAGVSASDICRVMGIGNWNTYTKLRDFTSPLEVTPEYTISVAEKIMTIHRAIIGGVEYVGEMQLAHDPIIYYHPFSVIGDYENDPIYEGFDSVEYDAHDSYWAQTDKWEAIFNQEVYGFPEHAKVEEILEKKRLGHG